MRRLFSRLFTLIFGILIISIVVSFFTSPSFKEFRIEIPETKEVSARAKAISMAFPVRDSSGYTLTGLTGKNELPADNNRFTPVDLNFYDKNNLTGIVFGIQSAELLDDKYGLNSDFAENLMKYLSTLVVPDQNNDGAPLPVQITHVQFLDHRDGINYAADEIEAIRALTSQFTVAAMIDKQKKNRCVTAVVSLGAVDAEMRRIQGAFAESYALSRTVRHTYEALKSVSAQFSEASFCIAFINSATDQNFSGIAGLDPANLKIARDQLLAANAAWGNPVRDLAARTSVVIDVSALYSALQDSLSPLKDLNLKPYSIESIMPSLRNSFTTVDYTGKIQNRILSSVFISYYQSGSENRTQSGYLPFTRAENARDAMQQLNFIAELVEISALGTADDRSALVFNIPRREIFPVLHHLARPLAEKLGLLRKKDGAARSEQSYSIDLVRGYLAYKLQ